MNKHILSIAFLFSVIPCFVIAHNESHQESRTQKNWVATNRTFTLKTHLTVTPANYEQWKLVDHEGLELIKYEFTPAQKQLVGSAGMQEWVFTADKLDVYAITFQRNDETKQVLVHAFNDIVWCGKGNPHTDEITF